MGIYRRRLLLVFAALPVVLVAVALTYMAGMHFLEGEERSFWHALEWASETLTTTGYGADARWEHPAMTLFVVALQFISVFLVYMLVPLIMLPMLESRFERRLPRKVPDRLRGHMVIFSYGPAVEALIEELIDAEIPIVIIELDEDEGRSLIESWQSQAKRYRHAHLLSGPTPRACFEAARLQEARAIVANGGDEDNAIAVMNARELGFEGKILAVVEEPHHRQPLEMVGADAVVTPRHVLGRALAARASHNIHPRVDGVQQLGSHLRIEEVRVHPRSELAGKTLKDSEIGQRTGASVIGQWHRGQLDAEPKPETRVEPRGLLAVIGESEAIDRLTELASAGPTLPSSGPFVVAGCGEVGQKVAQSLREAGETVVVVDQDPRKKGVDIVGDIADSSTLEGLDLAKAQGLVLALDNDSATLFATLIIKNLAPHLPTIARVNHVTNLERLYRAGADFALSIAQVSAQIMVLELTGRDILALDTRLKILRTGGEKVAELGLSARDIRQQIGCSIVAIERDGGVQTQIGPNQRFEQKDTLYVCGPHRATERFAATYGSKPVAKGRGEN